MKRYLHIIGVIAAAIIAVTAIGFVAAIWAAILWMVIGGEEAAMSYTVWCATHGWVCLIGIIVITLWIIGTSITALRRSRAHA